MTALAAEKCTPCAKGLPALSWQDAAQLLADLPGWELVDDGKAISRRFKFKNFVEALSFVNNLAEFAEAENHHPDLKLGWGYCEVLFQTHSIGGLHRNDFILAARTNELAPGA